MKLNTIKKQVYFLTCTKNTQQLKKQRPDLIKGKDLRYKQHWQTILEQVKKLRLENFDFSLDDLNASEKMLKESLVKVCQLSGMDDEKIEIEWQRIQLEAQFSDIHIEEL
ncbi:hypothetical protein [Crocosphaera chwakensis]|uniref:Uncharacterized protein n=1 Tax=Crocosphaera chwakensis CCY0110 TaxID=391612 RepID=A3ISR2_9CHRO|nr:hypothetical protein [Crocosphaera chwakensis]EAZ90482.1 hypothetical protein CY0110_26682 [Crocosphaera chwakensis CCY0110]